MHAILRLLGLLLLSCALPLSASTQVVLLGTGTPNADPARSGPAVAVVVDDQAYLVDAGPGIVRRAAAMAPANGGAFPALAPARLDTVFITHLHSDHTVGLPDLLLTPWVLEREQPLRVFGPEGTRAMMEHLQKAYQVDIHYRLFGQEPANNSGWRAVVKEVDDGLVFADEQVKVRALRVRHGSWPNAFAYRFETPDRVVVVSGDIAPDPRFAAFAQGADVLVHEVYSVEGFRRREPQWQRYHAANHTSSHELGELAAAIQPGKLVLYHVLFWGADAETVLAEVRSRWDGEVVLAEDLSVH